MKYFTFVGLPKAIHSDLGSNFTSNIFKVYPSRESNKVPINTVGEVIPSTETSIDHYDIETDISNVSADAVLTQLCSDGLDHLTSYYSKKFNKHQHTYATVEKECYALVLALQHVVYINVTRFPVLVFTDHNPLVSMSRMKDKNQKILRCSLIIQWYNLEIIHIKGKDNIIADALPRIEYNFLFVMSLLHVLHICMSPIVLFHYIHVYTI